MRPSKMKTPLARLRVMLNKTIEVPARGKKRAGQKIKRKVMLSQQDIADWLGISKFYVQSIETGRRRLTNENAFVINSQTGANLRWLLGQDTSPHPIKWPGRRLTQRDFDKAQENFRNTSMIPLKAQRALPDLIAMVANVLLHAAKRDEIDLYTMRLRRSLLDVLKQFPKPQGRDFPLLETDFTHWIDRRETRIELRKDYPCSLFYEPMIHKWTQELLKLCEKKYVNMPKVQRR